MSTFDFDSLLVYPYYLRTDLAYTDSVTTAQINDATFDYHNNDGGSVAMVQSFTTTVETSGVAGNRNLRASFIDNNGNAVILVPGVSVFPANKLSALTFRTGFGASYAADAGSILFQYVVMPPVLLLPGWRMFLSIDGAQVGDIYQALNIQIIKIPTGPDISNQQSPKVVTPVLI